MWSLVGDRSRAIRDPSCGDEALSNSGSDPSRDGRAMEVDEEKIDVVGGAVSEAPSAKELTTMEVLPLVLASIVLPSSQTNQAGMPSELNNRRGRAAPRGRGLAAAPLVMCRCGVSWSRVTYVAQIRVRYPYRVRVRQYIYLKK